MCSNGNVDDVRTYEMHRRGEQSWNVPLDLILRFGNKYPYLCRNTQSKATKHAVEYFRVSDLLDNFFRWKRVAAGAGEVVSRAITEDGRGRSGRGNDFVSGTGGGGGGAAASSSAVFATSSSTSSPTWLEKTHCRIECSQFGMLHRLDKDTSGSILVGTTPDAHAALVLDRNEKRWTKIYVALVHGQVPIEHWRGQITYPLKKKRLGKSGWFVTRCEHCWRKRLGRFVTLLGTLLEEAAR